MASNVIYLDKYLAAKAEQTAYRYEYCQQKAIEGYKGCPRIGAPCLCKEIKDDDETNGSY